MADDGRIPFAEVIEDDNLMGRAWAKLTFMQKITLKAFYGLPLSAKVIDPKTGHSELDGWAILQESCTFDELGYVTSITPIPYTPREYSSLWAVIGRRAGKTSHIMCFIVVYEALFGGHDYYIQPKQTCIIYLVAHKLGLAQANMPFVRSIIGSSEVMSREVANDTATGGIELKNGITILPSPPSLKAQRGIAVPVVTFDEVAFWYSDPESANPDYEVERAVSYSLMQFPNGKKVGISSPWSKEGLLWKNYKAGTGGSKLPIHKRAQYRNTLVAFGTTAAFGSIDVLLGAKLAKERLQELRDDDPDAFSRESLCVFPDSVSGFFNRVLLDVALAKGTGISERAPVLEETIEDKSKPHVLPSYVAAMDPAFRQDSFAFCIAHTTPDKTVVVDLMRRWVPPKGQKLDPKGILLEIADICRSYGIMIVYSDQYQLESLHALMLDQGMAIEGVDFTAKSKSKIFGNLNQLVNQQKLVLLDPDMSREAKSCAAELISLERRTTHAGGIQIAAPQGKHDDMAVVLALAAFKSIWMLPVVVAGKAVAQKTPFERGMETIRKRQAEDREW